jgi:hypothetical protein
MAKVVSAPRTKNSTKSTSKVKPKPEQIFHAEPTLGIHSVENTLMSRKETHGDFDSNAAFSQQIKRMIQESPQYSLMSDTMREGLDMIASKMARICTGNAYHEDSWHDIAGYATLVEKSI